MSHPGITPRVPLRARLRSIHNGEMDAIFTKKFEEVWVEFRSKWCRQHRLRGCTALYRDQTSLEFFHRVLQIDVEDSAVESLIDKCVRLYGSRGLACPFTLSPLDRPTDLPQRLVRRGFERGKQAAAMVYDSPPPPVAKSDSVQIERLSSDEKLPTWTSIVCECFELPAAIAEIGRPIFTLPEVRLYLASVGGVPAGTTLLYSSGQLGYIDLVGTLPQFRQRGIASTLVVRAIADSLQLGNDLAGLEVVTGSGAERLYQRLGFRTVHHRERYFLPSAAASGDHDGG